jgi:hypothetical protein
MMRELDQSDRAIGTQSLVELSGWNDLMVGNDKMEDVPTTVLTFVLEVAAHGRPEPDVKLATA